MCKDTSISVKEILLKKVLEKRYSTIKYFNNSIVELQYNLIQAIDGFYKSSFLPFKSISSCDQLLRLSLGFNYQFFKHVETNLLRRKNNEVWGQEFRKAKMTFKSFSLRNFKTLIFKELRIQLFEKVNNKKDSNNLLQKYKTVCDSLSCIIRLPWLQVYIVFTQYLFLQIKVLFNFTRTICLRARKIFMLIMQTEVYYILKVLPTIKIRYIYMIADSLPIFLLYSQEKLEKNCIQIDYSVNFSSNLIDMYIVQYLLQVDTITYKYIKFTECKKEINFYLPEEYF